MPNCCEWLYQIFSLTKTRSPSVSETEPLLSNSQDRSAVYDINNVTQNYMNFNDDNILPESHPLDDYNARKKQILSSVDDHVVYSHNTTYQSAMVDEREIRLRREFYETLSETNFLIPPELQPQPKHQKNILSNLSTLSDLDLIGQLDHLAEDIHESILDISKVEPCNIIAELK